MPPCGFQHVAKDSWESWLLKVPKKPQQDHRNADRQT